MVQVISWLLKLEVHKRLSTPLIILTRVCHPLSFREITPVFVGEISA